MQIANCRLWYIFCVQQVEETSTEVTNRRSKVSFSPKDIDEVVSDSLFRQFVLPFYALTSTEQFSSLVSLHSLHKYSIVLPSQ